MAKNTPAFQFYPQDFIGGVMLLNNATVGVYIKLLSALWIANNKLPNDFKQLARATLCTESEFDDAWQQLQDKFEIAGNVISHPRFTQMIELREKRKASGSLGGTSRVANAQANVQANTQANVKQTSSKVMKNEDRRMKIEDCSLTTDFKEEKPKPKKQFKPPSIKQVTDYCQEKSYEFVDAERFVNFYASKNWMIGSNKMAQWRSAVAGWNCNQRDRNQKQMELRPQDLPRSVKNEMAGRTMKDAAREQHCKQQRIEGAK